MKLTPTAKVAIAYKRRGWPVVPVPFRQKGPKIDGWSRLRLTEPEILQHFNGERMNIGVLLGEPSGIVDVDLDCPESRKLAADLLPPTDCVFGRNGSPGSHRIYAATINGERTSRFKGPATDVLVELRATGSQTLFPPSTHPGGDEIGWESTGEPAHVDLQQLVAAVRELSGACLLLRRYPEEGSRHDFALGLAGGLLRAGWSVPKIQRYIEVIAAAAGDDEVEDRIRVIADTKAAIAAGEKTTGWPSLARLIDGAEPKENYVNRVRQLLRVDNTLRASVQTKVLSTPPAVAPLLWRPFPVKMLPKPILDFIVEGSQATGVDPVMYVMPVLATCAAAIGSTRQARIKRTWFEPAILWTATVARSGQRKSAPFEHSVRPLKLRETQSMRDHEDVLLEHDSDRARWERDMKEWKKGNGDSPPPPEPAKPKPKRFLTSDPTIEAVALLLSNNPRGLLLARDELSGWICSHNTYKGGRGGDIQSWNEMYHGRSAIIDRKTGDKTIHVDHASVSVTGTIRPRILRRVLTPEYFEAGLSARLLLAMPPARPKRWTDDDLSEQTELVYDHTIERLLHLQHNVDSEGVKLSIGVPFTPEARNLFIEFYDQHGEVQDRTSDDDLAAALAKLEAIAARLSLIFHFIRWADDDPTLDDPDFIGAEDITAGIAITQWFVHETTRIYDLFHDDEIDVEARELLDWVMLQGGIVTPRDLQRHSRVYATSQAATDALDALVRREWGHWKYDETGPAGGKPSRRFFAATETTADNSPTGGVASDGIVDGPTDEGAK